MLSGTCLMTLHGLHLLVSLIAYDWKHLTHQALSGNWCIPMHNPWRVRHSDLGWSDDWVSSASSPLKKQVFTAVYTGSRHGQCHHCMINHVSAVLLEAASDSALNSSLHCLQVWGGAGVCPTIHYRDWLKLTPAALVCSPLLFPVSKL